MNYRKGFTLIEILIVVSIMALLTAVIIANVSSARNKSADGAAKAILAQYKTEVELYANGKTSNYVNACNADGVFTSSRLASLQIELYNTTTQSKCGASDSAYAYAIKYKSNPANGYCIDSTGVAKELKAEQVNDIFNTRQDISVCL